MREFGEVCRRKPSEPRARGRDAETRKPKSRSLIGTKSITTGFHFSSQVYNSLFINVGEYDSQVLELKLTKVIIPLYL